MSGGDGCILPDAVSGKDAGSSRVEQVENGMRGTTRGVTGV